jgi:glyoxylase-like metal-dependent hydrolase (beta-lactamase superfamily II)
MRIHHLNCGTHCPLGGTFFDGASRSLFASIVTHCLLIETDQGLVLVDTGYGLQDVQHPHKRLARIWPAVLNVRLREHETALRQIEALGFSANDVRHIVLTHLDFDHAGGLEDFPAARIHVMEQERHAAERKRRGFVTRQRYRPTQWDEMRDWRTYATGGEPWFGFEAVRSLDGLPPEILMVPLRGHTAGHAGIAVRTATGWLLDAGDAYMYHAQMNLSAPCCTPGLAIYQAIMDSDRPARAANQERLRELKRSQGAEVTIFCSHDTQELAALVQRGAKSIIQPGDLVDEPGRPFSAPPCAGRSWRGPSRPSGSHS